MRWIRHFTVYDIQREQDIGNVDRRGKRGRLIWIIVRESAAADGRVIAADMQVVDVLDEISYEEERIDLVLMFGGLSKLILFVSAGFQRCRIVLAEVPGAEGGLSERLLRRECIVDDGVRSGESAIQAGHSVRRIERSQVHTLLSARSHNIACCARADYAVVLQILIDLRVLRINIRGFSSGRGLKC